MSEQKIKVFNSSSGFIFLFQNYSEKKIQLEFESECVDDLEFIEQVGDRISQMKHLSEISLTFQKSTNLKQEGWKYLFKGLEQLNQLEYLEIQIGECCFLEDQGLKLLADAISSLVNLKKLTIAVQNANFITSSSVKYIVDNLQNFLQLVELKLQILEYQIVILEEKLNIWSGIYFLKQIKCLDLSLSFQYNDEKDIDEFFSALLTLKNLTQLSLNLDYNQQNFDFIEKLTFNLAQITQLKELSLGFNKNQKENNDIALIFTFFRKLINLEKLDFQKCMLQSYFVRHSNNYYESLSYLPNLRDLKIEMNSNNIQIKDYLDQRINCLNNKQNIRNLTFKGSEVYLNDEQSYILNQALKNNKQMEYLKLQLSAIRNENQSIQLFESLCSFQQLKQLEISLKIDYKKINFLNKIIQGIANIKSLQHLKIKVFSQTRPDQDTEQIAFSYLKFLNLNSFECYLNSVILGGDLQELGQALQNQKQLQKLIINIQFKQYSNLFFIGIVQQQQQQQQQQNQFQIESIEDFVEGIKSLQCLKELQYGINHSIYTQALNPVLESLSYLTNLEKFQLLEDKNYEDSQLILLMKSLSKLNKLKQVKLQQLKEFRQETFQNQIQNISYLNNIQQLQLINFFQNMSNTKIGIEKTFFNLSQLLNLELKINITKNSELLFEDVINGIGQLNKLQQLIVHFGAYQFTDTGSYHFSQACSGLQNLIELEIFTFNFDESITSIGVKFLNEGFSKLKQLKSFESSFNIPKFEFSKIVEGFFTNKCLQKLKINFITQQMINLQERVENEQFIDQNIKANQNIDLKLTTLHSFFYCSLRQQTFEIFKFYENLINLSNLNEILIFHDWNLVQDQNQLVEVSYMFKNLALAFQQFKKLEKLNIELRNCQFNLEIIPIQNMKYLSQLKNLNLSLYSCFLYSDYILFDQFKYLNQLQMLDIQILQGTKFGKQAAISLGSSFIYLKMLQKLQLILQEDCQIESEGAAKIGTGLGYLKNLTFLTLFINESCKIDEIGAMKLGEGISQLFALNEIRLTIQKNNNVTKKAGAFLMASLRNKKYLEFIQFILEKQNNEQSQEFLDELSKLFEEAKFVYYLELAVGFSQCLLICPVQLKNFISQTSYNKVTLQIGDDNSIIKTKANFISEQKNISIQFTYNGNLVEFTPKIEFELLQKMEKNQVISIILRFSNNEISNKILRVKEQIEQVKVKNLGIILQFYQFTQSYLDEIILPALKNEELLHFGLALYQKKIQEIDDSMFMQIAQHISKSNLLSLDLQFTDLTNENLFSDKCSIILKELWNSKTLRALSLNSLNLSKLKCHYEAINNKFLALGYLEINQLGLVLNSTKNLKQLCLNFSGSYKTWISELSLIQFSQYLKTCINIEQFYIDLDSTEISSESVTKICQALVTCSKLEYFGLKLSSKNLNINYLTSLDYVLTSCKKFRELYLYHYITNKCDLDEKDFDYLGQGLQKAQNLSTITIYFSNFRFTQRQYQNFFNQLSYCQHLSKINLSIVVDENSPRVNDTFSYLGNLNKLSYLQLSYKQI
ncbi:hypothetical protein ABPG73_007800 [Tetrahymena malaccensis]